MNGLTFEIYQWLVPLVALFFISRTIYQYFHHGRTTRSLFVWLFFWIVISLLAIVPNAISVRIAEMLGFKSNVNAIIFVALGLLFVFMFYLSATIEKLERQITDLVREIALRDAKKKDSDDERSTIRE